MQNEHVRYGLISLLACLALVSLPLTLRAEDAECPDVEEQAGQVEQGEQAAAAAAEASDPAEEIDYHALLTRALAPENGFLNARAVNETVIGAVTKHLESDPSTPIKDLMAQADSRPTCKVNLPVRRRRARDLSQEELFLQSRASTAIVAIVYKCGRCPHHHINFASAFVISEDGLFVTNHHVLKAAEGINAHLVFITSDGRLHSAKEVMAGSKISDLAIVRTDSRGLTPYAIEPEVRVGEPVYCLSNPNGYFYLFTDGMVAGKAVEVSEDRESRRLYITADYAVGSSGGPVINARGAVVGVISATRSAKTGGNSGDIQMVVGLTVPVVELLDMIE